MRSFAVNLSSRGCLPQTHPSHTGHRLTEPSLYPIQSKVIYMGPASHLGVYVKDFRKNGAKWGIFKLETGPRGSLRVKCEIFQKLDKLSQ